MKVEKVSGEKTPMKELFEVKEITKEDIMPPSANFLKFLREHKDYSFLNSFTMADFIKKVSNHFTSSG